MCAFHHYEKRPPGPLCSSAFKLQKIRAHARISELRGSSARIAFVSIDEMVHMCMISLKCALHSSQRASPRHGNVPICKESIMEQLLDRFLSPEVLLDIGILLGYEIEGWHQRLTKI